MKGGNKTAVATEKAPAAIGPYSQAIRCGDFLFCSGQIALDPVSGKMSEGGVPEQTRLALKNLNAVLDAAGLIPADVVKTTVYMTDLGLFSDMNGVVADFFVAPPPLARTAVGLCASPQGPL